MEAKQIILFDIPLSNLLIYSGIIESNGSNNQNRVHSFLVAITVWFVISKLFFAAFLSSKQVLSLNRGHYLDILSVFVIIICDLI